jgi:hypothetical protein
MEAAAPNRSHHIWQRKSERLRRELPSAQCRDEHFVLDRKPEEACLQRKSASKSPLLGEFVATRQIRGRVD